jgi:hypothetical protein
VLPRLDVDGPVTSEGAGPASAGLETSAPVAVGIVCVECRVRRLAIFDAGVNEQAWPPETEDSVKRLPLFRPRSETIVGAVAAGVVVAAVDEVVAAISPSCSATAV